METYILITLISVFIMSGVLAFGIGAYIVGKKAFETLDELGTIVSDSCNEYTSALSEVMNDLTCDVDIRIKSKSKNKKRK